MPNYYNPYQYPQSYYPAQAQVQAQAQQTQMQIQNGGFVSVRNEGEARNYPIAPGNSITFKDETAPYVYTKTMGFSQLDRPIFEKYRLVKEDAAEAPNLPQTDASTENPINNTINDLKAEIEAIWGEIEGIKNDRSKQSAESAPKRTAAKRERDGVD